MDTLYDLDLSRVNKFGTDNYAVLSNLVCRHIEFLRGSYLRFLHGNFYNTAEKGVSCSMYNYDA